MYSNFANIKCEEKKEKGAKSDNELGIDSTSLFVEPAYSSLKAAEQRPYAMI